MAAGERLTNWDETRTWAPAKIHDPATDEEVADIVKRAVEQGRRVKAIGGALSWSDCAVSEDEVVRMDKMATVLDHNADDKWIKVQGGARLSTVNDALAAAGLAFDNFGSIVMQSAAGYTGTGSHGTGGRTPILSSYIREMTLVDGLGELRTLSPTSEPELFSLARVHLGALGVVTSLTFDCTEPFMLEERLELMPWDNVLSDLDELVDNNDFLKLWWLPYTDKVQVYRFNRTDEEPTRLSFTEWFDTSGLSSRAFTSMMAAGRVTPGMLPHLHKVVQRTQFKPHRRVDRSDKIIRYAGTIPRHQESEYAVHRQDAAEALDRTRRMINDARKAKRYYSNFPLEVRFVAPDDIAMSPTRDRPSCYIGPYIGSVEWSQECYVEFEEMMLDYDGRPHWGKTFNRSAEQLRHLYGEGYDRFAAARRELDPHGVFRSDFVDRVFPE